MAMAVSEQNVLNALRDARLPMIAIAKQIDIDRPLRDKTKRALYVDCDSVTLYGAVMQTTNLEYNGHQIEVDFIEPRALLRFLVDDCPPFGPYLLQRLHGGHGNVMTYMDGSKPGNPLRPDDGRAFEAAYCMFHEWPEHLIRQA